jgi:hypothetical protein
MNKNKRFLLIIIFLFILTINTFAGNFYVNAVVIGPKPKDVIMFLKNAKYDAYISRAGENMTVVFEKGIDSPDDFNTITNFCSSLSLTLKCTVFLVQNHDDSVLYFKLYKNGKLLDQYDSCPGYFDGKLSAPKGGDIQLLADIFNVKSKKTDLKSLLHPTSDKGKKYISALERHTNLVKLLKLPEVSIGFGYEYVKEFLESSPKQSDKEKYGFEYVGQEK